MTAVARLVSLLCNVVMRVCREASCAGVAPAAKAAFTALVMRAGIPWISVTAEVSTEVLFVTSAWSAAISVASVFPCVAKVVSLVKS